MQSTPTELLNKVTQKVREMENTATAGTAERRGLGYNVTTCYYRYSRRVMQMRRECASVTGFVKKYYTGIHIRNGLNFNLKNVGVNKIVPLLASKWR